MRYVSTYGGSNGQLTYLYLWKFPIIIRFMIIFFFYLFFAFFCLCTLNSIKPHRRASTRFHIDDSLWSSLSYSYIVSSIPTHAPYIAVSIDTRHLKIKQMSGFVKLFLLIYCIIITVPANSWKKRQRFFHGVLSDLSLFTSHSVIIIVISILFYSILGHSQYLLFTIIQFIFFDGILFRLYSIYCICKLTILSYKHRIGVYVLFIRKYI